MSGKEWSPWNLPNERGGEGEELHCRIPGLHLNGAINFREGQKKPYVVVVDGLIATRSMLKSLAM